MVTLDAVRLPPAVDRTVRERLVAAVSPERQARLARLRQPEDVLRGACGELLARLVLSRQRGVPPAAIRFTTAPSGKPAADGGPPFNVSHAGVWVVCATADGAVGVDVERHTPVAPATIAAVLCPEERSAHARLAPDAAASYFFSRWTLKESLVKATGEGLRAALDAIHCVERGGCFDFPGWAPFRGWRCPLEDGYSLAVCHRGGEPPAGVRRVSFDALCG